MRMAEENRPVGERSGLQNVLGDTHSIPQFPASAAMDRAQGMLLLLVFNPANGRHRRRIYLSLSAAEKAAHRARERGHVAHIVLGTFTATEVV